MKGVLVKLALLQRERDFLQEPATSLLDTVYATVLKLTGDVDLAAQVERLVTLERLSL
jgi:hypothetical protein